MTIKILPEEIINQIAAGEVVENPAAAIKEMIENSIDANSKNIEIEIYNSGLKKIVIKDDGNGISKEDLLLAPTRHATSKIQEFNDLYNIKTMGFRGEALASIFSIAKTKIISKKENETAYEISSENIKEVKESACQNGTTIIVEDIFYNTPARKKYLKSENLELKLIVDIIQKFSIYYYNIKFTLKHNDKILLSKPIFKDLKENIYYIFGKDYKDNLLYFKDEKKGFKIEGFIGKPSNISYSSKKNQFIYVNSRYVKSKLINDAIYEGFGTNLMESRHPFYICSLSIDPEILDVNVHPTKLEIKFENEIEIFQFSKNSIKTVFEKNEVFKPFEEKKIEINFPLNKSSQEFDFIKEENKTNDINKKIEEKTYFSKELQKPLNSNINNNYDNSNINLNDNKLEYEQIEKKENTNKNIKTPEIKILEKEQKEDEIINPSLKENTIEEEKESYGPLYEILKEYRIVGQINKTFIIIETKNEMIIIDQHVAEEKFFFETFKDKFENKTIKIQKLLKSEIITLTTSEMLLYKENLELIKKIGFETEEFGINEIIVRSVPLGIHKEPISPKIIKDMLFEISVDKKFLNLENEKLDKLASMSCKRSIKAGQEMTIPEIHKTIENLKKLKEPFNCPHGRPVLLNWSFKELEKKFKRIA